MHFEQVPSARIIAPYNARSTYSRKLDTENTMNYEIDTENLYPLCEISKDL